MRILALDWGTKRIGGAVSDPDGKIAFPLQNFIDPATATDEIKKLVNELEIEKILVGRPKTLEGVDAKSVESVERFVKELSEQVPCQFEYIDERFSSLGASKTLTTAGINQREQRGLVDNLAAQQLLQAYLDNR